MLQKARTGVYGLDEITGGGLPQGRTTLVCGGPGCGKTLLATQFLMQGALEYGEPGVFMSFEETGEELTQNVASLGFDLNDLVERKLIALDHVRIERSEIAETGDYDLDGLFIRLNYAIEEVGARRVVLDTIEALFSGLSNQMILRAELRRLFRWLKDRGMTAVVTAESGAGTITRHGLEEYVSDCVIVLDHRVTRQLSTRRMRIVKYRGSRHGTNEYPFLIDDKGVSVLPITSMRLEHEVVSEQVSTGIESLDLMFRGGGWFRGSSVLVSGVAGSGKTSIAAHFAQSTCARGQRCLYFAFEESPQQLIRNMKSIGIDLQQWVDAGLLEIHASRPHIYGLEMHLLTIHKIADTYRPSAVIIDPITELLSIGDRDEVEAALTRLIDFFKEHRITTLLTSLFINQDGLEKTGISVSSLMDTWILLTMIGGDAERNRGLYVLKSRGMAHSNQIREMVITDRGVQLEEVILGKEGVLTGSARIAREALDRAETLRYEQEKEKRRKELERKRRVMEARIAALRLEYEAEEMSIQELIRQEESRELLDSETREIMTEMRREPSYLSSSSSGNGERNEPGT